MIRKAIKNDISRIMEIIELSKEKMKEEKNDQWQGGYPSKELFIKDYEKRILYVFEEDKILKGCISIEKTSVDSYKNIIKESSKKDSYVFHRLCIDPTYRHQKIATRLLKYGENLAKKDHINIIKADTGIHNSAMMSLFKKLGYQKITEFEWNDYPVRFIYFEKKLGSEQDEI